MRACKCCNSPQRAKIEDAIARRVSHAEIARKFSTPGERLSLHSVFRHSKHLGRSIAIAGDRPLLDRVDALLTRLEQISAKAQSAKAWSATVAAMREVRETLELIARLTGQMPSAGQGVHVNVGVAVNAGSQANNLSDRDLDVRIAMDVSEATDNFNPETIDRLRRIALRNKPALEITAS